MNIDNSLKNAVSRMNEQFTPNRQNEILSTLPLETTTNTNVIVIWPTTSSNETIKAGTDLNDITACGEYFFSGWNPPEVLQYEVLRYEDDDE
jgi:hypothetical protein